MGRGHSERRGDSVCKNVVKRPGLANSEQSEFMTSKDMLNMLGRTLDTKLVLEMREATTGGEYAAQLSGS